MNTPARLSTPKARWHSWIAAGVIVAVSVLVYWPALSGGLLWDDAEHITGPELRSLHGLARIWFEVGATQQYYPVLHTAFWVEHGLWGNATLGYHLVNVLLHATSAWLFGLSLRRLAVPGTWWAALLFALHPVCVESVAWIAEQKNTLSLAFALAALLVYLSFDGRRTRGSYGLASGLFLLALLSKSVTATLPAALLVILWWRRGSLGWRRDVAPLIPWLTAGAAFGLFTAWVEQRYIHATGAAFDLSLAQRCLLAGRAIWSYLGKLVWPADLSFIYPRWRLDAGAVGQYGFPLAALAVLFGVWMLRARTRAPLAAALLFGGTLFPALGFFNVYPFRFSFVADHFQYGACLSIMALAGAGLAWLGAERRRWLGWTLGILLLGALGKLTWSQAGMYRDAETLYRTTLQRNPDCWLAHNNLGGVLMAAGRTAEAGGHFEQALRLNPLYLEAQYNLAVALGALGRRDEAIAAYTAVVQSAAGYANADYNLGILLLDAGRPGEALVHFKAAQRIRPDDPQVAYHVGLTWTQLGQPEKAEEPFAQALQLRPEYAEAENGWGYALLVQGRYEDAAARFTRALQLSPDRPDFHLNLGLALAATGRFDRAIAEFRAALRINPDYPEAHQALALMLSGMGRGEDAAAERAKGLRRQGGPTAGPP